ncbi:hypothetical protein [Enterovirga aerilata]|uniref:DUF3035 domain-containing protein n=1 Tax=Enterovirga aerilata TaxID=2730920 RepID=A0A849I952_9HYPH|nr:hypothetical protein [Enterovirga sp. DB1703]NNM72527.1 hypothetical protein [Enterovirga sp. DB1703]
MTRHHPARLGLCAVAATLAFGSAAHAQEGVAIKNLLGTMGIISPEKDPIRYRERAPLVLPPKMELRAPAGSESYASNNPQWPKDPDVVARNRRAAEERRPVTESEVRRMSENNPRLSIDEIRSGRNPNGPGPGSHRSDRDGVWISPTELGGNRPSGEGDKIASAPMRRTLTDPPSTLRQPARGGEVSRDFQGKIDQQEQDANPINWLTRAFKSNDDE